MKNVVVLVPIYKAELDALEHYSLAHSLGALKNRDVFFIGPEGLDLAYYKQFGDIPFIAFNASNFKSIEGYNRLLLSKAFYERFSDDYEFMLILQTDAILLRDELDEWCLKPFDYVGAPFFFVYELFVNLGVFEGDYGKIARVHVGNGGLSLRRIRKNIALLSEFDIAIGVFDKTGSSEDLFFSVMGSLSVDFILPNEITASLFSMEMRPSYYYAVNGKRLPMGGHAWWKYEPEFWRALLPDMPGNLFPNK